MGVLQKNECPCHSGKLYVECCKPYHDGKEPESALLLMRSRYSAYALGLVDYIVKTMHPHLASADSLPQWRKKILHFSRATVFEGLTIVEFAGDQQTAAVTFTAHLRQQGQDATYTEKSLFEKVDGRWRYKSGVKEKNPA